MDNKPENGGDWSPEDARLLRELLQMLAIWLAFALFLGVVGAALAWGAR